VTNNYPLVLGRWSAGVESWNGLIDEVRLYTRALTAAEVQSDLSTPIAGGGPNQAPAATLTAPASGATFTAPASVTLSATATDADGTVARVDFYNGSSLLGSDTTAPYSFTWSNVAAGTYSVKATAVDNAGASGSSAVATVTVTGNQTPTATLTAPANGASFTAPATVTLTANAADADGTVARVEFYNGSTLLGSDTTAPYSFTWSNVAAGTYALKATAVDNAGASGSSAVATITVTGNQAPTATLTAPANGATFTAPASVTLSATASDADGTVARVDFYNGSTLLGSDTTAPYSFTWSSVAAGTYALKATAVDNAGATGSSAVATVTVNAVMAPITAIVFQASSDHATSNVTSYLLEIFASGANPNTATPVASSDLGKPTPAGNGDITVDRAAFFSALAPGSYIATVSALGPGGKTRGVAVAFTR
jgi:predicted phage tail protein